MLWIEVSRKNLSKELTIIRCNTQFLNCGIGKEDLMNLGLVFDIHRATTHDGPGMRTTVFFKGCPVHCLWCHNPESINPQREIWWNKNKCIGCLTCIKTCKKGALADTKVKIALDKSKCDSCMECTDNCPAKALAPVGEYYDVESLVKEAIKDKEYFEEFGGGVTVSGGEPLLQHEFVVSFLRALKEKGINTALDTSGYVDYKILESAYPYVDTFLYDIKLFDREQHHKFTGVYNDLIIDNFKKLINVISKDSSKKLWIRTPLIPKTTATIENIAEIGEFLKEYSNAQVERWELCAFNNLCKDKYEKMGIKWHFADEKIMNKTYVESLLGEAQKYMGNIAMTSGITSQKSDV